MVSRDPEHTPAFFPALCGARAVECRGHRRDDRSSRLVDGEGTGGQRAALPLGTRAGVGHRSRQRAPDRRPAAHVLAAVARHPAQREFRAGGSAGCDHRLGPPRDRCGSRPDIGTRRYVPRLVHGGRWAREPGVCAARASLTDQLVWSRGHRGRATGALPRCGRRDAPRSITRADRDRLSPHRVLRPAVCLRVRGVRPANRGRAVPNGPLRCRRYGPRGRRAGRLRHRAAGTVDRQAVRVRVLRHAGYAHAGAHRDHLARDFRIPVVVLHAALRPGGHRARLVDRRHPQYRAAPV